jgi:atypical dual specificity phosphatase
VADAPDHYRVEPSLFAGAHPGAGGADAARAVAALRAAGVTAFVDLTMPGELPPYTALAAPAAHHARPIGDFGVPGDDELLATLDLLDELVEAGEHVYVHCHAGVGRTGTVVACRLVRQGAAPVEALTRLAELRTGCRTAGRPSPETAAQRELVARWPAVERAREA